MFAEFPLQPMTWWETLPLEFGGWGNVALVAVPLGIAACLAVALVVRELRRAAWKND